MQQRSLRGNLVLLFADVTIRNGGALRDVAHASDDARAGKHRLAERRFTRRRVTYQGKIPKVPGRRRGHNSNPLLLLSLEFAAGASSNLRFVALRHENPPPRGFAAGKDDKAK